MTTLGTTTPNKPAIIQYVSDGVTTQYNFPFVIQQNSDIAVYANNPTQPVDPSQQKLELNTDYTVTIFSGDTYGGYITLTNPITLGWYLTLASDVELSITTDYSDARNFNGANLDTDFQRLVLMCQELNSNITRCIQFKVNSYLPTATSQPLIDSLPEGYIIIGGPNGTITSTLLETNDNWSTLRSELASEGNITNGTNLIGYWNILTDAGGTLTSYLNAIQSQTEEADGPFNIGVFNYNTEEGENLHTFLIRTNSYELAGGSANQLKATIDNAYDSYGNGDKFFVVAIFNNTGPATFAVNGGSYDPLVTALGPLIANEIVAGMVCEIVRTGSQWMLLNPAPAYYGAMVYLGGTQNITANTPTVVAFDTKQDDLNNIYSTSTNQFIPTRAGVYQFQYVVAPSANSAGNNTQAYIYKNGSSVNRLCNSTMINATVDFAGRPVDIRLNGTDSVTAVISSTNAQVLAGGQSINWASIKFIGV